MTAVGPLIFSFSFCVRVVVSLLWQTAVPTVRSQRVLYQYLRSEELSLPRGFFSEMFHNCSRSEHVQTQAAIPIVENWLDYSRPATTSVRAASFSASRSNILLLSACLLFFDICVHIDDWHYVSLQAWPFFKPSLTTMGSVQHSFVFLYRGWYFNMKPWKSFVPLTWQWRKRKRTLELWIIRP